MSALRKTLLGLVLLTLLGLSAAAVASMVSPGVFHSVELKIAEYSPNGVQGGVVVPASCPSYAHSAGSCDSPIISCSPATVRIGSTTTCSWTCPAGSTSSSGLNFSTGGGTSGSQAVTVSASTNYGVQCPPENIQSTFSVTAIAPSLSLTATPNRVRSGSASSLSWSASSVNSCTLKRGSTTIDSCASSVACANAHTTASGNLTAQSVFTLSCATDVGTQTLSATINITPSTCEVGTTNCPN